MKYHKLSKVLIFINNPLKEIFYFFLYWIQKSLECYYSLLLSKLIEICKILSNFQVTFLNNKFIKLNKSLFLLFI